MKIRQQLQSGVPDIGHYRFFRVFDPKPRNICAASFPERVLHHAVMNVCEPFLDNYLIYDSYACRKGKGNRKAVQRAQVFAQKFPWYLKLDIKRYFDSIDHGILLQLLGRRFKEKRLVHLFRQVFETYHTVPGRGLPIGNLISQHVANFYLGLFDHWIKNERRIKGYLRYMDDMVIYGGSRRELRETLSDAGVFLDEKLALALKSSVQLNRSSQGIPFLGYRVFPGKIKLSARSRKRFVEKFKRYENNYISGQWHSDELIRCMEPLVDFTRGADATGFRKSVLNQFGVLLERL